MGQPDCFPRVVALVAQKLNVPVERLTADSTLPDLGADSLDAAELVMALEEEFSVQLADMAKDVTLGGFAAAVQEQIEAKTRTPSP